MRDFSYLHHLMWEDLLSIWATALGGRLGKSTWKKDVYALCLLTQTLLYIPSLALELTSLRFQSMLKTS